jgi:hypothetical protein
MVEVAMPRRSTAAVGPPAASFDQYKKETADGDQSTQMASLKAREIDHALAA